MISHTFDNSKKKEFFYRDDKNIGLTKLKILLKKKNIFINTHDLYKNTDEVSFELHFYGNFQKQFNTKTFCIMPEAPEIDKMCKIDILLKKYDKIFTNIDDDVDNKKVFKINAHQTTKAFSVGKKRNKLCCIISSNKNLNSYNKNSGYTQRVNLIKWFANNSPGDLDIYGKDWNRFFFKNYYLNRIFLFLQKKLNFYKKVSSQFRGTVSNKEKILKKYKFNICFENVINKKGYFTGIIFDSFNSGCVPVYLGCKNVDKYIPDNCYIDMRKFNNFSDLHNYLKKLNEYQYISYQLNIKKFLKSKMMKKFHYKNFNNTILLHLTK